MFCRPFYEIHQNRKVLIRSTGSFSTIEENIVAPTPRKFPGLASSSPKYGRREKRKNEESSLLFGEAGSEIQNILFHPQNLLAAAHLVSLPVSSSTPPEETHINVITPIKTTPLRTSNPITLNSPFHIEERSTQASIGENATSTVDVAKKVEKPTLQISTGRLYPANGRSRTNTHYHSSRKELSRSRSLSWPGNSKMEAAC